MGLFSFIKKLFSPVDNVADPFEAEIVRGLAQKHQQYCYLPVVEGIDGALTASKFSGIAWLAENEEWPVCDNCGQPMQLFLQLSGESDLPEPVVAKGHAIQLFYCCSTEKMCECDCDAYDAASQAFYEAASSSAVPVKQSWLLRYVDLSKAGRSLQVSPVEGAFKAKVITGWERKEDYPEFEDLYDLEPEAEMEYEELEAQGVLCASGDKLLGWPNWVQGPEYSDCPVCGRRMKYIFQIDSEDHLPYMFGDAGTGHIMQCEQHPEILTFRWSCC